VVVCGIGNINTWTYAAHTYPQYICLRSVAQSLCTSHIFQLHKPHRPPAFFAPLVSFSERIHVCLSRRLPILFPPLEFQTRVLSSSHQGARDQTHVYVLLDSPPCCPNSTTPTPVPPFTSAGCHSNPPNPSKRGPDRNIAANKPKPSQPHILS